MMAPDKATTTATATSSTSTSSPSPTPTSPMLASINAKSHIHLVVGIGPLTATRCTQSLASGAHPILIAPSPSPSPSSPSPALPSSLQDKITAGLLTWHPTPFRQSHLVTLGRAQVDHVVDAVFVVLPVPHSRDDNDVDDDDDAAALSPRQISALCQRHRIPVNVADAPHLCTFSLLSVHTDGPLQIGVTTNGRGCKLAARIRREIAGLLPPGLGDACERLGRLRRRIQEEDCAAPVGDLEDSIGQGSLFNGLVRTGEEEAGGKEHAGREDEERNRDVLRNRRGRWLAQMCEYWPLKRLAGITDEHVEKLLLAYPGSTAAASTSSCPSPSPPPSPSPSPLPQRAHTDRRAAPGRIILAGSGPGHPDLLTCATLKAIQTADVILADKLVPSPVLDLIPRRTPVHIARKFPGNADRAQEELLEAALAGLEAGQTVLRLKQGDPYLYGRGGEEVLFFQARGMGARVSVLPGVTSALSASLFAGIPATQRDVADQVLICTGTGKKGKPPTPPSHVPSQTVVFLMALHRIGDLVAELTSHAGTHASSTSPPPPRALFPLQTPCAVIERASCPDQRVIRTTLAHVAQAIEAEGSRPPGLLVVGHACHVLHQPPASAPWIVQEGFRGLDADPETDAWTISLQAAMAETS